MTRASGGNLARTPGLHPTLYEKCHGIFNDHRESGPRLTSHPKDVLVDSIVSPSLYWGVRTHTDHRVSTPADLANTSSSSNLVFLRRSPIQVLTRLNPA